MAKPLCFRLPEDLQAAVMQLVQASGMSASEWMRDLLHRAVFNGPPDIEEGYLQGRQIGTAAAFAVIREAIVQAVATLPPTAEEAIPYTQLGSPGRTPHPR